MKVFSAAEEVKRSKNKDFAGWDYLASVSLLRKRFSECEWMHWINTSLGDNSFTPVIH